MKENEFRILIPEKKFIWSANKVIYSTLAISFIIMIGFYQLEDHHPIGNLAGEILIITMIVSVMILVFNLLFMRKSLEGRMDGVLILKENRIIAGDKVYDLEELTKIDFNASDHFGRRDVPSQGDLNPQISQGVGNNCVLILKNNQKIRIWFQQREKDQLTKNRDLLIGYHLKGKMSFLRLFRILGITKTKEVKAFKESLKKL